MPAKSLQVGSSQHILTVRPPEPLHSLYQLSDQQSGKSGAGQQSLEFVAPISYRLSLKSNRSTNNHEAAAQRLKEMREEERERKKNSRAVMIEQNEFDKRGRLTSKSGTMRATATPDPKGPLSSPSRTASPSHHTGEYSRTGSLVRSRSGLAHDLIESGVNSPRSSSPGLVASASQESIAPATVPSSAPSLRRKILQVLAPGPRSRRRIVAAVGTSPEPSILRLLTVLAHAPDELQDSTSGDAVLQETHHTSPPKKFTGPVNRRSSGRPLSVTNSSVVAASASSPSTVFVLRDEAYLEIAAAIGAGQWVGTTVPEKARILKHAKEALERLRIPSKADEWTWLDLWEEEVRGSDYSLAQGGDEAKVSPAEPSQKLQGDEGEYDSGDEHIAAEESLDGKAKASASGAARNKSGSTTRDRLTRAVKGRGPKGEDLKKAQEKARKKRERELEESTDTERKASQKSMAADSEKTEVHTEPPTAGVTGRERDTPIAKRQKKEDGSAGSSIPEASATSVKVAHHGPSNSQPKSSPVSVPSNTSKNANSDSIVAPTAISRKAEIAARSNSSVATRTRRASQAMAGIQAPLPPPVPLPSLSEEQQQQLQHHGPSASASLLVAEPWLDIRGPAEWRRLAERFARVWAQYEKSVVELGREKKKLLREMERAAKEAQNDPASTEEGEKTAQANWRPGDTRSGDTAGRNDDESNLAGGDAEGPSPPLDLADLKRLVEAQKSREGELKRMKAALVKWKKGFERRT